LFLLQTQYGLACKRCQIALVVAGVFDQLLAHARIPEALEMLGNRIHGYFMVRAGREEGANIVGHFHQVMNVHRLSLELRDHVRSILNFAIFNGQKESPRR